MSVEGKPKARELYETVDYTYVVNKQLMEVAKARSRIFRRTGEYENAETDYTVFQYYMSVETLYSILLPWLRGDSGKYLEIAHDLFNIYLELNGIEGWHECDISEERIKKLSRKEEESNNRSREEGHGFAINFLPIVSDEWKKCREVEELLVEEYRILEKLPKNFRKSLKKKGLFHRIALILDLAVEEMIKQLDNAGLLIRGRSVSVGVPE